MPPVTHLELIQNLQDATHECLGSYVDRDMPVAVLDFPDIKNCGDSAIWLGEMAYLRDKFNKRPSYVSRMKDFSRRSLQKHAPEGPIFIHGGGNFGDIWPAHQDFRETILESFPSRQVIQFPQSIHFQSAERLEHAKRVIGKHGAFTLLVRDERSRALAQQHFECEVKLCPDMAFCIGHVPSEEPEFPVLAMLRQDKEKKGHPGEVVPADVPCEDWITENSLDVKRAKLHAALSSLRHGKTAELRLNVLDAAARNRFGRGIRQISRAQAIVTDRLHVHICSLLLGKPHAVLDNNYGKIRGFMEAFSGGTSLSYKASSLNDGVAWAKQQAAEQTDGRAS